MEGDGDDLDPEFVKRMGEKALRILHRKMGWLPITEWTQEDFDQEAQAAMWLAEPDDFDDTFEDA